MTYIVERNTRFYVVTYDGLDPLSGRERRRWIPIGHDRSEAESVASRLDREHVQGPPPSRGAMTVGEFLSRTWMPNKRRNVRATTAHRYAWFIERSINPAIGAIPLRRLRSDHLDDLYETLATTGGRNNTGLAPKTILEVHMIIRAALAEAMNARSSTATSLSTRAADAAHPNDQRHVPGPQPNFTDSSPPPGCNACTRRCTSLPTPECDAAKL